MALGDQTESTRYTVGRGSVYFMPDGETAYRLLGNAPSLTFTQEIEDLKHYSSREGINTVDKSVVIQQDLMAAFALDDIKIGNTEMFFMADGTSDASQTQAAAATTNITLGTGDELFGVYEIGAYNISSVTVATQGGSPTWTNNTDYEVDLDAGLLYIPTGTGIPAGTIVTVTYDRAATTVTLASAATSTTIKGHFMFVGDPAVGTRLKIKGYGSLKPAGDVSEITDEWKELPFEIEFETEATYTGLVDIWDFGTVT